MRWQMRTVLVLGALIVTLGVTHVVGDKAAAAAQSPAGAGVPNFPVDPFWPDGTYVREVLIAREVRTPTGTAVTMAFSPDRQQRFLYVSSGDQRIRILDRQTLQVIGTIGRLGHYAGQCHHITDLAVDSQGNLYASENEGRRVQKFVFKGLSTTSRQ